MLWTTIIILLCKLSSCYGCSETTSKGTYISVASYFNWATHQGKVDVPDQFTHILYDFTDVASTGEIYLTHPWTDTEMQFPGDSSDKTEGALSGHLNQLYLLKKANRNLKVLLSMTKTYYMYAMMINSREDRTTFSETIVRLVISLGLDGIALDWGFPFTEGNAANISDLLRLIRAALDVQGSLLKTPYHFQLMATGPSDSGRMLHFTDMDPFVDFWILRGYKYGSSKRVTTHQANLFSSTSNPNSTPSNTEDMVKSYISQGIASRKIILGLPALGRIFNGTDGLGEPFDEVKFGVPNTLYYHPNDLPPRGATEHYDETTGSSYSYDATSKQLVSYDNMQVVKQKAAFIQKMELAGATWPPSGTDKVGKDSLIQEVVEILGGVNGTGWECSHNQLTYPVSKYKNLQARML